MRALRASAPPAAKSPVKGTLGPTASDLRRARKYTPEAIVARRAWKAVRRPLAACRYEDGMLAWMPAHRGLSFWELECCARVAAEDAAYVPPLPERQRNLGVYGVDLAREERRSGVPRWFMPNLGRRARVRTWTGESPWRWVEYVGHHLRVYYHSGVLLRRLEVMLYLPRGVPWTAHAPAVRHLLTGEE